MLSRSAVPVLLLALALFVGGGFVIDGGSVVLGAGLCAAGLMLFVVVVGLTDTAHGRSARELGFDGFRAEPIGFDRPKDEGRLL